jgi:hypothetical protein
VGWKQFTGHGESGFDGRGRGSRYISRLRRLVGGLLRTRRVSVRWSNCLGGGGGSGGLKPRRYGAGGRLWRSLGWLLGLGGLGLARWGLVRFGFGVGGGIVVGVGREEIVVVAVDGVADGFAPAVGAEGVDVFVLGKVDGLQLGLEHVGDSAGESGFYVAADYGGDEAGESGAEIARGEIVVGEEIGEVFGEFFSGLGAGLLLGVIEAEVRMAACARRAAAAAIGERE